MRRFGTLLVLICTLVVSAICGAPQNTWALASGNIPLDSPVYDYLEKLAALGLIRSDTSSLKPYARAEAARLVLEAEENRANLDGSDNVFADGLLTRLRELLPRE